MTNDSKFQFTDFTVRRTIADQVVLLQTKSSQYYVASGVGLDICVQVEAGATLAQMIEHICNVYDTTAATAAADVSRFLKSLESAGMVLSASV